jgi:hypothetical protein
MLVFSHARFIDSYCTPGGGSVQPYRSRFMKMIGGIELRPSGTVRAIHGGRH